MSVDTNPATEMPELFPGTEPEVPESAPVEAPGGDDGDETPPEEGESWLPESLKGNEFLRGYRSADEALGELAALKEARSKGDMGEFVRITEDPKQLEQVFTKLGKPASPDKYGFEKPEGFDDKVDPEKLAEFTKLAHEANFTQKQYEKVMGFVSDLAERQEDILASNVEGLTSIWGPEDSAQFKDNQKLAVLGYNTIKDPVVMQAVKETPEVATHPAFLNILRYIGQQVKDDVPAKSTTADGAMFNTPNPATKIEDFRAKYGAAIRDPMHPEHSTRLAQLIDLHTEKSGLTA